MVNVLVVMSLGQFMQTDQATEALIRRTAQSTEDSISAIRGVRNGRPRESGPFFTKEQSRINKAERLLSLNVWRALYFEEAKRAAKLKYCEFLCSRLNGPVYTPPQPPRPLPPQRPLIMPYEDAPPIFPIVGLSTNLISLISSYNYSRRVHPLAVLMKSEKAKILFFWYLTSLRSPRNGVSNFFDSARCMTREEYAEDRRKTGRLRISVNLQLLRTFKKRVSEVYRHRYSTVALIVNSSTERNGS